MLKRTSTKDCRIGRGIYQKIFFKRVSEEFNGKKTPGGILTNGTPLHKSPRREKTIILLALRVKPSRSTVLAQYLLTESSSTKTH